MKWKSIVLTSLVLVAGVGSRAADVGGKPSPRPPTINEMLREMAKGDGVSEDEAKAVTLALWKLLWKPETTATVKFCSAKQEGGKWIVGFRDQTIGGAPGCRATITFSGTLEKVEYIRGA